MSTRMAAFMSYARFDDQHDDGQVSELRERLSAEVRVQTGDEFPIFQDRNDIAWGQNWKSRIEDALDSATLLLVVVTPSFFRSPVCRDEVQRFLDRERALARSDLVLPLYYVGAPELDDPQRRDADPIARALAERQFADWRELRFEPFTAPVVRRALAQLAVRMRDAFWHPPRPAAVGAQPRSTPTAGSTSAPDRAEDGARPAAKVEPPTHIVDAHGRADFTTIGAAITAARPGDRILVRPGLYQEVLVIDKPLELLGDGPVADVVVQARDDNVVRFAANIGRVANLTLRQLSGSAAWSGVAISQGRLELEGCDIVSRAGSGVIVRSGADPRLRRNSIHDCRGNGVFVYDDGLGTLEDNDIGANGYPGISIKAGGNPTLRRNQIHDGAAAGVLVLDGGLGMFEDNDIVGNTHAGVQIRTGGNPTLRRNRIHDGKAGGVYVYDNGRGVFEDNDIAGNAYAGVDIKTGGNPTMRRNRIRDGKQSGVYVHDKGRGTFEDNEITGNQGGPWNISADSEVVRRNNTE